MSPHCSPGVSIDDCRPIGWVAGFGCSSDAAVLVHVNVNVTLFSRVTLISKVQLTSDLDYFHDRDLPFSRVKSHDNSISDCRVDSEVLYSFIYTYTNTYTYTYTYTVYRY